jgi:nuclear pore complex protein Nup54
LSEVFFIKVVFYINQRVSQLNEQTTRVLSQEVVNFLNKQEVASGLLTGLKTTQTVKQQLDQMSVVNVLPMVGFSDEELKNYLDKPPAGLNPLLWEQAKKNNQNPKKLMPVQIIGLQVSD